MILALRALGVGDLATGVPALRALRRAFPGETLALAAPPWLTPLIDLIGAVDEIVPVDDLSPGALDRAAGLAVNLHGSGPQSHRLLLQTHPGKLWAFACAEAGFADGPAWDAGEHEVRRWCRLLTHYGLDPDPGDLDLRVPAVRVPAGVTIVHPGAKAALRRWPPERFAAVARELAARGHHVVVTGSAGERPLAQRVAAAAGLPSPAVLAGRTDTAELAGLVAGARLLVSGDTGIAHLATAYRTPSVVLFGPMPPSLWGPPPRPYHRPIWHGTHAEPGDGPAPATHPALLSVTADEVLGEIDLIPPGDRSRARPSSFA